MIEGGKMRTTLLLCLLLICSSPSFAADEEEVGKLNVKMEGAFKCATYAANSQDLKEQQRLFQIGLKAARDVVEGMKGLKDSPMGELQTYMPGATIDFVVGQMWEEQSKQAYDEIFNRLSPERSLDAEARKREAERIYRERNCSLIQ